MTDYTDDDFAFDDDDMDAAADPFADMDDAADEWADLPGEPSDAIATDMLKRALREDPFATTSLDDCIPSEGIAPAPFSRFERASMAYIAASRAMEQDDEAQEILRLIAIYWLRRSKAFWLD